MSALHDERSHGPEQHADLPFPTPAPSTLEVLRVSPPGDDGEMLWEEDHHLSRPLSVAADRPRRNSSETFAGAHLARVEVGSAYRALADQLDAPPIETSIESRLDFSQAGPQENVAPTKRIRPARRKSATEVPCQHCGKMFSSKSTRDHHVRWHGPKTQICDVCGKGFVAIKDLRRHEKTHRPADHEFFCDHLDCVYNTKGFAREEHLMRHKRTHQTTMHLAGDQPKLQPDMMHYETADEGDHSLFGPDERNHTSLDLYKGLPANTPDSELQIPDRKTLSVGLSRVTSYEDSLSLQWDDQANESDYADSIFSQESTTSSATSLDGGSDISSTLEMVDRLAPSLFCNEDLQCINVAAVNDLEIGPERFRRNVRRMIKIFGKDLRIEAGDRIERGTAAALQTRRVSTHAAHAIMTRAGLAFQRQDVIPKDSGEGQQSDASVDSADEDDENSDPAPGDEGHVHEFICSSAAYIRFKQRLLDFTHEPYEKRLLAALDPRPDRGLSPAAHIARQLSWVPTYLFRCSEDRSLRLDDWIKGLVEEVMGECWNWSPLRRRLHRLEKDHYRLSWQSVSSPTIYSRFRCDGPDTGLKPSGETRHIDLPIRVKEDVQHAIDTAPSFIDRSDICNKQTRPSNGGIFSTTSTGTSGPTQPLPIHHNGDTITNKLPLTPHDILQSNAATGPIGSPGGQSQTTTLSGSQTIYRYVYLCVEAGSRVFVGVDCDSLQNDAQFFEKLKSEYDSARGWLRLWFSTWRYDHCEFFQFQKTGLGLGARLKIAFPEPTDPLYDYLPKPLDSLQMPPHGPISHDEFHLHYYHQTCPSLLSWERWHHRQICLSLVEKGALEAAPKRIVKLDMQNGKREQFYGLYAKEARSALRVIVHMSFCCPPGVIFFFLWLYQWGHGADLQGAAVPVQLSLTLTAAYLGVLYWTR